MPTSCTRGLEAAGVTVPDAEFERLVREIDAITTDETAGPPRVSEASPR